MDILKTIDNKKTKLDSYRPLPPDLVKNLEKWMKVELTYTSNAIEGNTLARDETALVIEKGITIGGKTIQEHLEAINHAEAIEFIKQLSHKKKNDITARSILDIHSIVLHKIDPENAGLFRRVSVRISGSTVTFPNYLKVPELMDDFISWLHSDTSHPVTISALAHLNLVTIHPFVDGNGRTARLLMNLLLLQTGYPCAIISPINRLAYIKSIEKAQLTGDKADFLAFIYKAVDASLDIYLKAAAESTQPV